MKKILFLLAILAYELQGFAQVPSNDNCSAAISINDARDYCSSAGQYTNSNASPSFTGTGSDVWFKFTARNFEMKITVIGGTNPAIRAPQVRIYGDCNSALVGTTYQDGNTTIFNNAGLIPGKTYYFTVSSSASEAGTFQLCIENYPSSIRPGQDFVGATLICTTENIIHEVNISGPGANPNEAAGTCLDVETGQNSETHSAWYKWTAANSGTLVFTITPSRKDDLDWVLYELGPEGNIQSPSAANKIRCAAGHGLGSADCPQTAQEPAYTQTGLDFVETDINEASCSGQGQNGMLKFIDMKAGYVYALLVNNFTIGNNGFEIAFTDKSGKAGTGLFKGPKGKIMTIANNPCTPQQSYTFRSNAADFTSIQWYFGEGASTEQANTNGTFNITYSTPGLKTVVLQLKNNIGCSVVETSTFMVGLRPNPPNLSANKADFCLTDTISLSTPAQTDVTYKWSGPGGFTSTEREPTIPVTSPAVAGLYSLIISRGDCSTASESITIPEIYKNPVAAFRTDPTIPAKLSFPATIKFFNQSTDADSYLWDFGDGTTSTEENPEHTYTGKGNYDVTLTAIKTNVCTASLVQGKFLISEVGAIFIPNTFTPNNDSINDEFVVNMNNIKTFQIQIFNRYGILMYSSQNLVENWDGTYKNEQVPVGTYYYVLDAIDFDNNLIKKSGSVTILR